MAHISVRDTDRISRVRWALMSDSMKSLGNGSHAVICLHGWFGSAEGWGFLPQVADLETFTYYFPELRGYGARRAQTGTYSMQEYAADALSAADDIGLQTFSVVGHSMGGKAAAALLIQARERVRAFVGISPVAPAPVPMDDGSHELFFGAAEDPAKRKSIIDFTTGNRYSAAWLDAMVRHSVENSTPEAFAGAVQSWVNDDYTEQLGSTETPIAVIAGEHDPAMSAEVMRQSWMQMYKYVELIEMPSCGHYAMYETPVALATHVEKFLADH